jgi:hypothetical protein
VINNEFIILFDFLHVIYYTVKSTVISIKSTVLFYVKVSDTIECVNYGVEIHKLYIAEQVVDLQELQLVCIVIAE